MATKSYDLVKIQNLEANAGLTVEAYEKKYLFHRLKGRFLHSSDLSLETSTPDGHENIYLPMDIQSPTQADGLTYEDECALRIHGAQLCFQVCNQLKLPLTTALTSLVIFHRFFSKNSFVDYDYREISMAALYLGGKVEETMRKTWDIAGAFASVFNRQTQNPVDIIIKQERVILRELGFELFRISDHPHKFIESFYHFFKVDKQVAQKAWYYLNDSYLTNLCVHFPSQVIAAGALYLALRVCNHPMPTQPWWILLECTFSQIEQVSATILSIYEFEKMDFRQAKRILSKANRVAYVIKHSEIYGAYEKIDNSDLKKTLPQQQQQDTQKIEIQKSEKKSLRKKSKSKEKKSKNKRNKSEKKKNKQKDNKKEKKQKKRKSRSRSKSEEKKNQKKHNKDQKKDKEKDKSKEIVKQTEKEKQNQNEQDLEQLQEKQLLKESQQQIEIEQQQETLKQKMDLENDQLNGENQQEKKQSNEKSPHSCQNGDGIKSEPAQNGQIITQELLKQTNPNEENMAQSQKQPTQNKLELISRIRAQLKLQQNQKHEEKEKEQEKEKEKEKEKEVESQKDPQDSEGKDSEEDLQLQEIKQRIMAAKKRNE